MAEQRDEPTLLLSLETYEPVRYPIKIDGVIYEMRLLREFSPLRRQQIVNIWQGVKDIMDKLDRDGDLTDDEELLLDEGHSRIIRASLPDCPRDVIARLDATQREELVGFFFARIGEESLKRQEALKRGRPPKRSTGAKRSRASSGSTTAATPATG